MTSLPIWLDAIGQSHRFTTPPQRIVSLVPSETQSVVDLGGGARLLGITDYCPDVNPTRRLGGTKNPNLDAILALQPDLVLANKEENTQRVVERLLAQNLRVHVSFPTTLAAGMVYTEQLATLLGITFSARVAASMQLPPLRTMVPIWRDPWMTFQRDTYAHSVLEACGLENIFADRKRRKNLAADLSLVPSEANDGDHRYPRLSLEEIVQGRPELILLPDEPYSFAQTHADELREATGAEVRLISGKPLFWYGTRSCTAARDLVAALSDLAH